MSFASKLKHRANIYSLQSTVVEGLPSTGYVLIGSNVRCYIDLGFIRPGRDRQMWEPAAGRPDTRSGVFFALPNITISMGNIIEITRGPNGFFQVDGAMDEAWRPENFHHYELSVVEVSNAAARAQLTQQEN